MTLRWVVMLAVAGVGCSEHDGPAPPTPIPHPLATPRHLKPGIDAGVDAGAHVSAATARELVQKCRVAVWTEGSDAKSALERCNAASSADRRPQVQALRERAEWLAKEDTQLRAWRTGLDEAAAQLDGGNAVAALGSLHATAWPESQTLTAAERRRADTLERQATELEAKVCPRPGTPTCLSWFQVMCWYLPADDWRLPADKTLKLDGKLGPKDWRPPDARVAALLRQQSDHKLSCGSERFASKRDGLRESHLSSAGEWIASTREDPTELAALWLYLDGEIPAALAKLDGGVLADQLSQFRPLARTAYDALDAGQPEDAMEALERALQLDHEVIAGPGDAGVTPPPSFGITERAMLDRPVFADAANRAGLQAAAHGDLAAACQLWKRGALVAAPYTQRLKDSLARCAERAKKLAATAKSCADLDEALGLAPPDSDVADDVTLKRTEMRCP